MTGRAFLAGLADLPIDHDPATCRDCHIRTAMRDAASALLARLDLGTLAESGAIDAWADRTAFLWREDQSAWATTEHEERE